MGPAQDIRVNMKSAGGQDQLVDLPIGQLADIVWGAQASVLQVETLPHYGVPDDDVLYARWIRNEAASPQELQGYEGWFARVRAAADRGVDLQRIHIVPDDLTSYLKFEIEVAYLKYCVPNGEAVGIITQSAAARAGLPAVKDFYLLDDKRLILPQYDEINRFVGLKENVGPDAVAFHIALKARLLAEAVPVTEFYSQLRAK